MSNKIDELKLTKTEEVLFQSLVSREREVINEFITPLREAFGSLLRQIEERLHLEPNAFGTTHVLDMSTLTIKLKPDAEDVPVEA